MKKIQLFALALAGLVITSAAAPAPAGFAVSVVSYDPGTGYVAGFTNVSAALGEPSQINPYGEATDDIDSAVLEDFHAAHQLLLATPPPQPAPTATALAALAAAASSVPANGPRPTANATL